MLHLRKQRRSRTTVLAITAGCVAAFIAPLATTGVAHATVVDPCASTPIVSTPYTIPSGNQVISTYNNPTSSDPAHPADTLTKEAIELINGTDDNTYVDISFFRFSDCGIAEAMRNAVSRSVRFVVLVDSGALTAGPGGTMPDALTSIEQLSTVAVFNCPTNESCMAHTVGAINHNKFMLFQSVGGRANVVLQTSENFGTANSGDSAWNNSVLVADAAGASSQDLWTSYFNYMTSLLGNSAQVGGGTANTDYFDVQSASDRTDGNTHAESYFSAQSGPDDGKSPDYVLAILSNVDCSTGTAVQVAMSEWELESISSKLLAMQNAGCNVNVVFRSDDDTPVIKDFTNNNPTGNQIDAYFFCYDAKAPHWIHSKFLTINGTYNGVANQKLVLTGSMNYQKVSLRSNDETDIRIFDTQGSTAWTTFHGAFQDMKNQLIAYGAKSGNYSQKAPAGGSAGYIGSTCTNNND